MRSRTIKPAFFKNDELSEISFHGRLLFVGLWCMADRRGVLENRHRRIKAEIFPYDDVDVISALADLAKAGLVHLYLGPEGVDLIQVANFQKHQNPHPKEPVNGFPESDAVKRNCKPLKDAARNVHLPVSCSPSPVSYYSVYGGPQSRLPSPAKKSLAEKLINKHRLPIPEHLTEAEADQIIDTYKDAKAATGQRAPAEFPPDPPLSPSERAASVEAYRKVVGQ